MQFVYSKWREHQQAKEPFDKLFDLFQQLINISSGDVSQALKWLTELDRSYGLTKDDDYSIAEFIQDLMDKGYIENDEQNNTVIITKKTERSIRQRSLEEIFSSMKRGPDGQHKSNSIGRGPEREPETRQYRHGDDLTNLNSTATLMNALKHSSIDHFKLTEDDLMVHETDHQTSSATALLIDLSHSMILYGEDRITPAKKVAMGLSELIMTKYPKDSLDIIAFGNEAWTVNVADLPYLKVGPFHTNTLAALQMARSTLLRRKNPNKQIFMITDGKPSCMKQGARLYKNSFGLDRKIINRVLDEATQCRRDKISITTFMIASDPYLQHFVQELTDTNKGRAYYASLDELGGFILEDYMKNRRKRVN